MLSNLALLSLLAPASAVFVMRTPSFGPAYDLVTPYTQYYHWPSTFYHQPSAFRFHDELPIFSRPSLFDQFRERQRLFSSTLEQLSNALEARLPKKTWKDADDHVETTLRVRGLSAEQLTAEVADGVLTVRGEGASCSLSLPFEVTDAASQIELDLAADGQLTVRVPKAARVPQPTPTALRITAAAETAAKETKEEPARPLSPEAVEADTLKKLEEKFPSAPSVPAPTEAPSPSPVPPGEAEKKTPTVEGAAADARSDRADEGGGHHRRGHPDLARGHRPAVR